MVKSYSGNATVIVTDAVSSLLNTTDAGSTEAQSKSSSKIDIRMVSLPSPVFLTSTLKTAEEPGIFSIEVTSAFNSTPRESSTFMVKVNES